jgi:hypothetical protein
MSMVVAALVFVILLTVSMAHLAWSFGLTYPIRDEKLLAQTVVGRPGIEHMPPRWASFGIAVLTFAAGILALSLADKTSGGLPLSLAALPAAAIFLARGAVGYTQWWASMTPEPNFRFNDRRVYSPLCLAIGAGFLLLFIMRLL